MAENFLYYGDNLDVMRRHIGDESVDLVYLDPPFNSNASYNVLFAAHDGTRSAAQIKAFEDTWQWDQAAAYDYQKTVEAGGSVSQVMQAFRTFLGENDVLAYLAMMAPRLLELRRVLKPTGSIYLHCDPTASHYLKILMDAIFGPERFRNEIIWKRTSGRKGVTQYGRVHDVILFYTKTNSATWNRPSTPQTAATARGHDLLRDPDGEVYRLSDLTGAGIRHGETGKPWRGLEVTPKGRHWAYLHADMERFDREGRLHWQRTGFPRLKIPLDELPGVSVHDVWTDIDPINAAAGERLSYPTQKPEALLERIIAASSNEGGVVLDPFCGCGTAIAVAQRLKRQWIGIDITHLAVALMKHRLAGTFQDTVQYKVIGEPTTVEDAEQLARDDPYQFQWWALGLVGARPMEGKKGADKGIDGRLYFHEGIVSETKQVILSVKAGKTSTWRWSATLDTSCSARVLTSGY